MTIDQHTALFHRPTLVLCLANLSHFFAMTSLEDEVLEAIREISHSLAYNATPSQETGCLPDRHTSQQAPLQTSCGHSKRMC